MIKNLHLHLLVATTFSGIIGTPALADGMDFFFNITPGSRKPAPVGAFPKFPATAPASKPNASQPSVATRSAAPALSPDAPPAKHALVWFEQFDDVIFTMGVNDHERYVLKRPINQDSERLNEWIAASNAVAKKYRIIAKKIRAMIPSTVVSDIKEFQVESANWYDDTAQMYEDLTAPRAPAKTYEELQRAHQAFVTRSKNLGELSKSITELSTKLRGKYDVHQPKYTDESAKYIDSVAHHMQETN